jgi:DNA repair protein RadC
LYDLVTAAAQGRQEGTLSEASQRLIGMVTLLFSAVLRGAVGSGKPIISSSRQLHDLLRFEMGGLRRETLRILFLGSGKRLLADRIMGEGGISRLVIEPREIVREALLCDATDLILIHNHPSNNPQPSSADLDLTRDIMAAAALVNVRVLDHLIVTRCGVCSLMAEGYFAASESDVENKAQSNG